MSSVGVTHPGAHMFATWYNGAAKYWSGDPINDETATGIFILISMLFIQCLNLILPFSWFYGESSAERSSVGEAEPISAPELAAISETGSDAGVMPPISITCSPKAGDLDRMEPASAYDIVNEAADDDTDVISTSDLQADVGSTVEIVSDVKGEMAPTSGMGTDVRQPLEPRQDEGRPATQADVPKQHEAIMQRPEGSGKAFSLDSYDPERVETVRTFIELYCTCDTGVDEVSSDIHVAYQRATHRKLAYAHRQFTAVLRQVALQPIDILQIRRKHHLRGIGLNEQGDGCSPRREAIDVSP